MARSRLTDTLNTSSGRGEDARDTQQDRTQENQDEQRRREGGPAREPDGERIPDDPVDTSGEPESNAQESLPDDATGAQADEPDAAGEAAGAGEDQPQPEQAGDGEPSQREMQSRGRGDVREEVRDIDRDVQGQEGNQGRDTAGVSEDVSEQIEERESTSRRQQTEQSAESRAGRSSQEQAEGGAETRTREEQAAASSIAGQLDERFSSVDISAGDVRVSRAEGGGFRGGLTESAAEQVVGQALSRPGVEQQAAAVSQMERRTRRGEFEAFGAEEAVQQQRGAVAEQQARVDRGEFDEAISTGAPETQQTAAVRQQVERVEDLDFAEFKQPGRSTPGGAAVPGPNAVSDSDPGTPRAALRGGRVLAAERDIEKGEFRTSIPDVVPFVGGREIAVEGRTGEFEPVRDGDTVRFEQQDEFSASMDDGAVSRGVFTFGLTPSTIGEEFRGAADVVSRGAGIAGDAAGVAFQGVGEFGDPANVVGPAANVDEFIDIGSDVVADVTADDEISVGEVVAASEERLDEEASGTVAGRSIGRFTQGTVEIANVPAMVVTAGEAGELAASGVQAAKADNLGDFTGDVSERAAGAGAQFAETAVTRPAATASMLAGGLVGSTGIFRAARSVGPRTSAAARYSIQPGEEIAGAAGFRATKAVAGEGQAQRFFPDQEPLIFSEEAVIRAGRRARRRLGDVGTRSRLREFRTASRGQGSPLSLSRQRGEVETETETDEELGVPEDDPFRVSDKRLFDPAREFSDADDPSRFIDEPRTGRPLYEQDIDDGISGRGDPETATEVESFEENFNRQIRRRQRRAQAREARIGSDLGVGRIETGVNYEPAVMGVELQDVAQRSTTESVLESQMKKTDIGTETREESRLREVTEAEVDELAEIEAEVETGVEVETRFESETETESRIERETETETETELELETELEVEAEIRPLLDAAPRKRRRRSVVGDFEKVFEGDVASADEVLDEDL